LSYNTKVVVMMVGFVAAFAALAAKVMILAVPLGIATVALFVHVLFQQRKITQAGNEAIGEKYKQLYNGLQETHALAIRKLRDADQTTVERVIVKLLAAGSHLGSSSAWRGAHRIVGAGDIITWYDDGIKLVDEARVLIDNWTPPKGGIEGTVL